MVEITYQMVLSTLQTIALIVGIVYYLTIMRNSQKTRELTLQSQELARKAQEQALDTRQTQLFMQLYREESQKGPYGMMGVLEWEFNDYDDFYEKFGPDSNPDAYQNYIFELYNMEGWGVLVREDYVDIRMIALLSGGAVKNLWMKLQPIIYEERKRRNWPRFSIEFEYLYDKLIDYAEKHPELQL
jgi:hypothetical protein